MRAAPDAATVVELEEYAGKSVAPSRLSRSDVDLLQDVHGKKITVEYPTPLTDHQYRLTSRGWAGYLPVSPTLALRLHPRVELSNLFRMLEVAFGLKSFQLLTGMASCHSLEDFFERLAQILARRVLVRNRRGLYRAYVDRRERLAAVRGRIDVDAAVRAPWRHHLPCDFQEHTADVEDNQILLWTLDRIRKNAACRRPEVRGTVRTAFHRLTGQVELHPIHARQCCNRSYSGLNADYRVLHALCRFFLEATGPTHQAGGHRNLPFLLDVGRLFELYVAEWLRQNLPDHLAVRAQEKLSLSTAHHMSFEIDLVLYDSSEHDSGGNRPWAVLDTKYKVKSSPSTGDVAQVVAYAEAMGCTEAFLVYPIALAAPLDARVGAIRVRSIEYRLNEELEAEGRRFLDRLFG